MPYLITTKERAPFAAGLPLDTFDVVSRRAVGTLNEARGKAYEAVNAGMEPGEGRVGPQVDAMALPESGGTIGPLPDGTVIEVERVSIANLITGDAQGYELARHDLMARGVDEAEIIDAYNAAQED